MPPELRRQLPISGLRHRDRPVYSFGSRRQHPAIAGMIERAAWIGGVDGVSNTCAPDREFLLSERCRTHLSCVIKNPKMPGGHLTGTPRRPFPRIMLCDTWCDEKSESLRAAECGATMVRLDTPRSRRGDMLAIIDEVRWELDAHGYEAVKILLTGGVTREDIIASRQSVDAFGVGGAIANAPVIDFGMDIVEIGGKSTAKRGKRSGVKQVYELPGGEHRVLPLSKQAPVSGNPLLESFIKDGAMVQDSVMQEARQRVLKKILLMGSS